MWEQQDINLDMKWRAQTSEIKYRVGRGICTSASEMLAPSIYGVVSCRACTSITIQLFTSPHITSHVLTTVVFQINVVFWILSTVVFFACSDVSEKSNYPPQGDKIGDWTNSVTLKIYVKSHPKNVGDKQRSAPLWKHKWRPSFEVYMSTVIM
jgi:hypothetical protein